MCQEWQVAEREGKPWNETAWSQVLWLKWRKSSMLGHLSVQSERGVRWTHSWYKRFLRRAMLSGISRTQVHKNQTLKKQHSAGILKCALPYQQTPIKRQNRRLNQCHMPQKVLLFRQTAHNRCFFSCQKNVTLKVSSSWQKVHWVQGKLGSGIHQQITFCFAVDILLLTPLPPHGKSSPTMLVLLNFYKT